MLDFTALTRAIDNAKEQLIRFSSDKRIPLDKRWENFLQAPDYLKSKLSYCTSFEGLKDDFIMYDGEMHVERYETFDLGRLLDAVNDYRDDPAVVIDYDAFREDILSKNFGSSNYDW